MPTISILSNYLHLVRSNSIIKSDIHTKISDLIKAKIHEAYLEKKSFCNFEFPLEILENDKTIITSSLDDYIIKIVHEAIILDHHLHGLTYNYSSIRYTFGLTWN